MPLISLDERFIVFKIVYFGPGMSGKTTNLLHIHSRLAGDGTGGLVTLDTEGDRTIFFDFFPLELGTVAGLGVRFHLYTIPGQAHYEASRRLILTGADGVVFVADSRRDLLGTNVSCMGEMLENISGLGWDPSEFPIVLQYNKRDVSPAIEVGEIEGALGMRVPATTAVAVKGEGVMETLRQAGRLVVQKVEI
jgi:hypothetical protein